MRDEDDAPRPDGLVERLTARPWPHPVSYAPVLPRLARAESALRDDRRVRPRAAPAGFRGRLVDLVA